MPTSPTSAAGVRAASACLAAALVLSAGPAVAGCNINVGVRNGSATPIKVFDSSKVKSRGGTWRRMSRGYWGAFTDGSFDLGPGETYVDGYLATFGCNARRRYLFIVQCRNQATGIMSEQYLYYPSPNGWTRMQSFTKTLNCQ